MKKERKKRMTGFFPFSLLEHSGLYMIFWLKLIYSVEDISVANLLVDKGGCE